MKSHFLKENDARPSPRRPIAPRGLDDPAARLPRASCPPSRPRSSAVPGRPGRGVRCWRQPDSRRPCARVALAQCTLGGQRRIKVIDCVHLCFAAMRLAEYTDYTLRVLIYCAAHRDERVTIADLAARHAASKNR